ncbi:ferric citrate transporter FecA [Microbulbifer flavimaris]|uniref:Ferric citrate transporter FecA n=1 Tax=Microbulbifer flavimaris TaxID=1781068 RepID=A0ABX4HYY4_9GAMM|nr:MULTISPECIES: TonB-dependent receptor [Microbulbifer]KUJ83091.1 ferric citrate transporter FecA [Microbulbifer sp. ZGT114]PCO05276.1 ferric citrate transporter FecA [Microbulbifer flavimaris]
MTRFVVSPLAFALATAAAMPVLAEEQPESLETVSVIGDSAQAERLPGSAHVVDSEDLAKFEFADINRIVRSVPGVYLREEDGYGLRPNIGIRGSGSGRSSKISLMEDGVLAAPAPYAAPSAYYFPTTGRLNGIEVLKGPSSLQYGPFTVGGAVNLLSTPIPESSSGVVKVEAGENGENRLHTYYGSATETTGWLVETHQQYADGFREIDRAGSADIQKEDYLVKGRLKSDADATYQQQLDVKLQYSEELSGMSYVGLTDADFDADPNRRYGLTAQDEMQNRHSTVQLNHAIALSDTFTLRSQAYHNKFKRDWFKTDNVGSLLDLANGGDSFAQAVLDGDADYEGIELKHNNRKYDSRGVQVSADWQLATGGISHDLNIGVRRHWDEVDRFQPVETFDQVDGQLVFVEKELPTGSNNRVEEADATALFIYDEMGLTEKLSLTAALRYEDVDTSQQRYDDVARGVEGSSRSNSVDEWLPGVGLVYELDSKWTLLAGVHRGFAPPGAGSKDGVGAELSTNYEWGARFDSGVLNGDIIAFFSDYENTVQNCTIAVECPNGADSGTYSLGEAEIQGVEASVGSEWALANGWLLPLRATYTYTDAETTSDADGGEVLAGDNLAYLPENVFALTTGIDSGANWRLNLTAAYQDEMCINTGCNRGQTDAMDRTESLWVLDAAAHYDFSQALSGYLKIDNLLDEQAIISRDPDGARANKPRTAIVGMRYAF